jgi:glycerophosphoryl diester phosphodiesterase
VPENTLDSFRRAIADGAAATECDVHVSQDGEVVVMHDSTLDRTTSLKGPVSATEWSAMKGAGVPSLSDLTDLTKDRIVLVVEIKAGKDVERKVTEHLKEKRLVEQSMVFSFKESIVQKVKELNPRQYGVWLVAATQSPESLAATFAKAREIGADAIGVQYRNCSPELVREAHARKVPLFVWTVPPGPEVERLRASRVNFIITDHPGDVIKQLRG